MNAFIRVGLHIFFQAVLDFIPSFALSPKCRILSERKTERDEVEFRRQIATARDFELEQMRDSFKDQRYHQARKTFVFH